MAALGVCKETAWPYNDTRAPIRTPCPNCSVRQETPLPLAFKEAKQHTVEAYQRLNVGGAEHAQGLSSPSGYPFVFGFSVYESFEGPQVAKPESSPCPGR